jgi:hypothetical protein
MARCELLDYSDRDDSMLSLVEYHQVTRGSLETLREYVLPDQMAQIEEGDEIEIYRIENCVDGISATLIIWYNKEMACIDTGSGSVWGDWDEDAELVVTEEYGEAEDAEGIPIAGRLAYNTHGVRGIRAREAFHTLIREAAQ